MSDEVMGRVLTDVQHSCPSCTCQPHRALLNWTDADKGTAQEWFGTCVCGWQGHGYTMWQGAMDDAEMHVRSEKERHV